MLEQRFEFEPHCPDGLPKILLLGGGDEQNASRVSPRPDAETVMRQLPAWIAHYNEVHPHMVLRVELRQLAAQRQSRQGFSMSSVLPIWADRSTNVYDISGYNLHF